MSKEDLIRGLAELDAAYPAYQEAADYCSGDIPEVFSSAVIARVIARTGEKYKFGLASTPVRVLANKVKLTGITVENNQVANDLITEIRESSHLDVTEPETIKTCFTYGDSYLFSWPRLDDTDKITGWDVLLNPPTIVRAIYADDDPSTPVYVIKSWEAEIDGKERRRADLYYNGSIERYVTLPDTGDDDKAVVKWVEFLDPGQGVDEWMIEHDYGMPWSHFRNGMPHGSPEHRAAYGAQNASTKMLITQVTTTDRQGWPERYGLVDSSATLTEAHDQPDVDDDEDYDDTDQPVGGVGSNQRTGPGTMQMFTGLKDVGEFNAADPTVFLTPVDKYMKIMAQLTDTPLWEFDPSADQPSGVARRRASEPLIEKANNRKLYFTPVWRQFWARVLELSGMPVEKVVISWSPSFVIDDLEGWQILAEKNKAGVPWEVLLVEAGYTTQEAQEWASKRQADQDKKDAAAAALRASQQSIQDLNNQEGANSDQQPAGR